VEIFFSFDKMRQPDENVVSSSGTKRKSEENLTSSSRKKGRFDENLASSSGTKRPSDGEIDTSLSKKGRFDENLASPSGTKRPSDGEIDTSLSKKGRFDKGLASSSGQKRMIDQRPLSHHRENPSTSNTSIDRVTTDALQIIDPSHLSVDERRRIDQCIRKFQEKIAPHESYFKKVQDSLQTSCSLLAQGKEKMEQYQAVYQESLQEYHNYMRLVREGHVDHIDERMEPLLAQFDPLEQQLIALTKEQDKHCQEIQTKLDELLKASQLLDDGGKKSTLTEGLEELQKHIQNELFEYYNVTDNIDKFRRFFLIELEKQQKRMQKGFSENQRLLDNGGERHTLTEGLDKLLKSLQLLDEGEQNRAAFIEELRPILKEMQEASCTLTDKLYGQDNKLEVARRKVKAICDKVQEELGLSRRHHQLISFDKGTSLVKRQLTSLWKIIMGNSTLEDIAGEAISHPLTATSQGVGQLVSLLLECANNILEPRGIGNALKEVTKDSSDTPPRATVSLPDVTQIGDWSQQIQALVDTSSRCPCEVQEQVTSLADKIETLHQEAMTTLNEYKQLQTDAEKLYQEKKTFDKLASDIQKSIRWYTRRGKYNSYLPKKRIFKRQDIYFIWSRKPGPCALMTIRRALAKFGMSVHFEATDKKIAQLVEYPGIDAESGGTRTDKVYQAFQHYGYDYRYYQGWLTLDEIESITKQSHVVGVHVSKPGIQSHAMLIEEVIRRNGIDDHVKVYDPWANQLFIVPYKELVKALDGHYTLPSKRQRETRKPILEAQVKAQTKMRDILGRFACFGILAFPSIVNNLFSVSESYSQSMKCSGQCPIGWSPS
jgi:hypothetical protein